MFMTASQIALFKTNLSAPDPIARSDSQSSAGSATGSGSLFSFTGKSSPQERGGGGGGSPLLKGLSMRFTRKKSLGEMDSSLRDDTVTPGAAGDAGGTKQSAPASPNLSAAEKGREVVGASAAAASDLGEKSGSASPAFHAHTADDADAAGGDDLKSFFRLLAGTKQTATLTDFMNAIGAHPSLAALLALPSDLCSGDGSRSRCLRLFSDMDEDCTGSISYRNFEGYVLDKGLYKPSSSFSSSNRTAEEDDTAVTGDAAGGADAAAGGADAGGGGGGVFPMNGGGGSGDDEDEEDGSGSEGGTLSDGASKVSRSVSFADDVTEEDSDDVRSKISDERGRVLEEKDSLVLSASDDDDEECDNDEEDGNNISALSNGTAQHHTDIIRTASLEEFSLSDRASLPPPAPSSPPPPHHVSSKSHGNGSGRVSFVEESRSSSSSRPSVLSSEQPPPAPARRSTQPRSLKTSPAALSPYSQASLSSASPSRSQSGYSMGGCECIHYLPSRLTILLNTSFCSIISDELLHVVSL
jgi:hypothetical protein